MKILILTISALLYPPVDLEDLLCRFPPKVGVAASKHAVRKAPQESIHNCSDSHDPRKQTLRRHHASIAVIDGMIWGFPEIRVPFLGVPIIRIVEFEGPAIYGNYHIV